MAKCRIVYYTTKEQNMVATYTTITKCGLEMINVVVQDSNGNVVKNVDCWSIAGANSVVLALLNKN